MSPVLEVTGLSVTFDATADGGGVEALRGVDLTLDRGQSLAVVGETGSGKSTLALCLAGLVQPPQAAGSVRVAGTELVGAEADTLRAQRWATVALTLQGAPFNPVATVGAQVAEPLRHRLGMGAGAAARRAAALAAEMHLDPALLARYPHQLSGGERRRASLAMALALDPALVVLDEPTAGLDPVTRGELVAAIAASGAERGFALVVVSHDLGDAARLGGRTLVLYAGEVIEEGASDVVLARPAHPYSSALVGAFPVMTTTKDLRPIRGRPPDPRAVPTGCAYHPRCTQAEAVCAEGRPALAESRGRLVACHFGGLKTLLAGVGLTKTFGRGADAVVALSGVSLELAEGESLGIVGASGSGKSTLARILAGHLAPDAGQVILEGRALSGSWRRAARAWRRRIQLVAQDPADSLSPRLTVAQLVAEPLDFDAGGGGSPEARAPDELVAGALDGVGLPCAGPFLDARAHQLSGGQAQRVALARALVAGPKLVVADEPTAMLDASEQARLLVVLRERQVEMGLGLVLVSHDLAVVRKVCDRILVLDAGRVVEQGPSARVSASPSSTAARALVDAASSLPPGTERPGPGEPAQPAARRPLAYEGETP